MERIVRLLILFFLPLFARDEFIFWANYSTQNAVLFHQSQNLSMSMTKSENMREVFACELHYRVDDLSFLPKTSLGVVDENMSRELKFRFLNSRKNELLDCFNNSDLIVKDLLETKNAISFNKTFITLLPLRFIAEFVQDKVLIFILKKD